MLPILDIFFLALNYRQTYTHPVASWLKFEFGNYTLQRCCVYQVG